MLEKLYLVPEQAKNNSHLTEQEYQQLYKQSVESPDEFWAEQAKRLDWFKSPTIIKNTSFDEDKLNIKWFEDGQLNVAYNCIDRHLGERGNVTAIIWEGDDPHSQDLISYQRLHDEVAKLANGLKKLGVVKGDRVAIYMPMVPQAAYAMLACARIGAVHSVIFGGFSPNAIADRIENCGAKVIITADEGLRAGKSVPLKENVDAALAQHDCATLEHVVVLKHSNAKVNWYAKDQ